MLDCSLWFQAWRIKIDGGQSRFRFSDDGRAHWSIQTNEKREDIAPKLPWMEINSDRDSFGWELTVSECSDAHGTKPATIEEQEKGVFVFDDDITEEMSDQSSAIR